MILAAQKSSRIAQHQLESQLKDVERRLAAITQAGTFANFPCSNRQAELDKQHDRARDLAGFAKQQRFELADQLERLMHQQEQQQQAGIASCLAVNAVS